MQSLLAGKRFLYATPTYQQIDTFWGELVEAFMPLIQSGDVTKNSTVRQLILGSGRVRAKTAWDADTLRGDFADVLCLDEFQLMKEDTWLRVGAPMMLDTDGTAIFAFTPPSARSMGYSKARDPRHANRMYDRALEEDDGRWGAFHFTSYDNPHISSTALDEISKDMTSAGYRQEILAEDVDESGGVFWRTWFEVVNRPPEMVSTVRHWDLAGTAGGGDYTVGLLMGKDEDDVMYVIDVIRVQESPHQVEQLIVQTAETDGMETAISLPQDAGQAGKAQAQYLIRKLIGYNVHADVDSGSKVVRAVPVAAQAEGGNIKLVRGIWNEPFLNEIEEFPTGWHDDQVDALSAAFDDLVNSQRMVLWTV